MRSLSIVSGVLLVVWISCSQGRLRQLTSQAHLPEAGIIHKRIACSGDGNKSYALYIPGKPDSPPPTPLQTGKALPSASPQAAKAPPPTPPQPGRGENARPLFPVIIAFDPHGDGVLPVTMYKDLADKYGFILVGSNDSKNGLSTGEVSEIVSVLIQEIRNIYPVDTNRIYLLGFSGGARVASMAAMYHVAVKGIIGCGAGFSWADRPIRYRFDYFGIVGTADFNMNEILQLDTPLTKAGIRHCIITFAGPHVWPPAAIMEDAFQWITLNAMKDRAIIRDDENIAGIMNSLDLRITAAIHENHLIPAAEICREAIQFAEGLKPVEQFRSQFQSIERLPGYEKQLLYRLNILKKEENEKQLFMDALLSKDISWWKNRILLLKSQPRKGFNPEDTLMFARLSAFLSLFCYSNANTAMRQQNKELAEKVITIYELADPPNPEANYMRAIMLIQRADTQAALAQISTAVDKGFADKSRTLQQPEFSTLKNSPEFLDLLNKMK